MTSTIDASVTIVFIGHNDTGKTTLINAIAGVYEERCISVDGAVSVDKVSHFRTSCGKTVEVSLREVSGYDYISWNLEGSKLHPYLKEAHMAVLLYSHADRESRDRIGPWAKHIKTVNGPIFPTHVWGNKHALAINDVSFPRVSGFGRIQYFNTDVKNPLLTFDALRTALRQLLINDGSNPTFYPAELDFVEGQIGILNPTESSKHLLQIKAMYRGDPLILNRQLVHTGVIKNNDQKALISSISRKDHAQIIYSEFGMGTSVVRLGHTALATDNGPGTKRSVLKVKEDSSTVETNGRIHLNSGSTEASYQVESLRSFLSSEGSPEPTSDLHDLLIKSRSEHRRTKYMLLSELEHTKRRLRELEERYGSDDEDDDSSVQNLDVDGIMIDDDFYENPTQAY